MLNEAVDALECQDGKIYVDCTLGGGGHSELILKRISPNGRLISFDIDNDAINRINTKLPYRVTEIEMNRINEYTNGNFNNFFKHIPNIC